MKATATGSTLKKTAGCDGCEDAGAFSTQALASGNGYLEVTASETTTQRLVGLSRGNTDTTGDDIDFAFQFWPGGTADVRENGLYRNAETSYAPGDKFRIAVASGVVRYYKNGVLFYTSTKAPDLPAPGRHLAHERGRDDRRRDPRERPLSRRGMGAGLAGLPPSRPLLRIAQRHRGGGSSR